MKFKIYVASAVIIIAGALSILFLNDKFKLREEEEEEEENENPGEPYENFMLQRIYPNKTFDINAYREALNDAFILASTQRTTNTLSWTLEGPGNIGGRFNCLAVDPTNNNIMYAGSANGGVWKTTDNGNSWNPITDGLPYQAIGAIAINPTNSNEIWVGTGDLNISGTLYTGNGVYKSNDAGLTWNHIGLTNSYIVSNITFNPNNTNEVIIGTMGNPFFKDLNRGIYRTTDGGVSFNQTLSVNDSTGIIDLVQHPTNPAILYASSFTRMRTSTQSLVMGTEVYVYKSTDFGQTWNILSGGLPNGVLHERLALSISKSNPNILYAFYDNGSDPYELYKTTDSGQNWQLVPTSQLPTSGYGWYFGKIYISPNNPDLLYIPSVDMYYSTDGGVNWAMRTPPWYTYEVHADGHYIHFNSDSDFIYCTDGGLYRTYDAGATWTDIENIPNNQFYAITENPHIPGQYAGGVQDNGTMFGNAAVINNFTRLYGGDGFIVDYPTDPNIVYAESQYGNIVYDDSGGGGNWNGIFTDGNQNYNWQTPYFVSKHNTSTLFFAGQQVMRIDGAPYGSYTIISPVLHDPLSPARVCNISTINQSLLDSNILYAGTADGKVWNTLDYGNNWSEITPFQGSSYYVTKVMPSPNNASTAYVTRSGYRSNDNTPLIFKTIDNGANWTDISGDLPALAVNDIVICPANENIIFIANDAGVYYTTNGGVNWQRLGNNMPYVATLDIQLNYNNSKLIAGTFGRSIYTIDVLSIVGIKDTNPSTAIEVSIFPNPATETMNVKTDSKFESIRILNTEGKTIYTGKEKSINISSFQSGTYYLEISGTNFRSIKKFVKI